jgi:S1-C subfamily serine protease
MVTRGNHHRMPSYRLVLLAASVLLAPPSSLRAEAPAKTNSLGQQYAGIVRIENAAIQPDYRTPWNGARPAGGTGTGFLIGPNRFLTNAHVVSNSTRLIIRGVDDSTPHLAKIEFIAHDCDLALLSLEDPRPFEGVAPLPLDDTLPLLDSEVVAVGYPVGGDRISVTRGVVSRIDFRPYSHSGVDQHLAIQVDAAINPGNSGGPVMQGSNVVGVAFQGYSGAVAQNVGYIIPGPVVARFLEDIKDGTYDHYADLAIAIFPLQNPAMRRALSLPENGMGVLVAHVDSGGTCAGILQRGDVLLEIDGQPIASDGFIEFGGERVNMNEIVERKFTGDRIKLTYWRAGAEAATEVTLKRLTSYLMQANLYEKRPEYVVFAGLVFQPLDRNLLSTLNLTDDNVRYFFNYFGPRELSKERSQPVILTQVLPDAINTHFDGVGGKMVDTINGQKITRMSDLTSALEKAEGEFIKITLVGEGRPLVLDRARAAAASTRINTQYGVSEPSFLEP